ncbi:MAG: UDP-glucuronic acid dehydrogenase [Proteobacteria bacterium]|nr:MAG: UDP-glucuronic acid dehydrogenase [Pseudomonadota bacterium]
MKISILCSSANHPIDAWLKKWIEINKQDHEIQLIRKKSQLNSGDLLFLISCSEIIGHRDRNRFRRTLVIHASDLPRGRGWSPHVWRIIEGESDITVTLLEAEDKVDSGKIWKQEKLTIPRTALFDEINSQLFEAELKLMDFAIENFDSLIPVSQEDNTEPTYYPRRTPSDSKLDASKSIEDQFDLIRVCDPTRFPATVLVRGKLFKLTLERHTSEDYQH